MNLHHWRDLFHSGLMPLRLWEVKLGCEILVAYTKWKIRDVLRVYRHTPLLASTQWNLLFLFSKTLIIKNYQLFFKELVCLPLLYCFLACFHFPSTSFIILNISLLLLCSWTIHSEARCKILREVKGTGRVSIWFERGHTVRKRFRSPVNLPPVRPRGWLINLFFSLIPISYTSKCSVDQEVSLRFHIKTSYYTLWTMPFFFFLHFQLQP